MLPAADVTTGGSRRAVWGAVFAVCASILPAFLVGGVGVQLRASLAFDEAAQGRAIGAFFVASALSSAVVGRVLERHAAASALRLGAAATAGVQLAIALWAHSWLSLSILLAVAGMVNTIGQMAANLLISRAVPLARQGFAFGLKQSAMPAATMLAGLAVPLAVSVGWRWAFVGGAAFALCAVVIVPSGADRPTARAHGAAVREGDTPLAPLVALAVGVGLGATAASAMAGFLVSGAVHAGMAAGAAGVLLTCGSVLGIVMRLAAGWRADRRDGGHLRVVALMLVGGGCAYALFGVGEVWSYVLATPLAFGAGWAWPGLFNFAVVLHNPNAPAAATGITQTGTYVGAVAGPIAFGELVAGSGYRAAWLVTAGVAFLAAAAMIAGRTLLRRSLRS